jgi:hypothetical protein
VTAVVENEKEKKERIRGEKKLEFIWLLPWMCGVAAL